MPDKLTSRHDGLTRGQQEAAATALASVVSLTTARGELGLTSVYELDQPAAASLVTALALPVPTEGQDGEVVNSVEAIRRAVELLAGGGKADGSGASSGASGAGPPHSFPLLRRAAVARLAQLWLLHLLRAPAGSEWAARAREGMLATLLQLFELHRSGMAARSALEFLHVSKAAGTSMCQLAEVSGCRAWDFGMGSTCLLREFDDQPRWLNASHHWSAIAPTAQPHGGHPIAFLLYGVPRLASRKRTCSARLQLLRKRGLDFFANEYTVYNEEVLGAAADLHVQQGQQQQEGGGDADAENSAAARLRAELWRQQQWGLVAAAAAAQYAAHVQALSTGGAGAVLRGAHLCPRFANVAVLRDPVERFRSHLLFIAHTYDRMYGADSLAAAFAPGRGDASWWRSFAPALADNYLLRTLAGEAAFALPVGGLGAAAYMRAAQAVLAQVDVLLVLEAEPASTARACSYGLGWAASLSGLSLRNTSALLAARQRRCRKGHCAGNAAAAAERGAADWPALEAASESLRQLLPSRPVLAELEATAVQYDDPLYEFGALLSALDDVVWRLANASVGEPVPGLWSGSRGAAPKCGYLHMRHNAR